MVEFDYKLDYTKINFKDKVNRKLYRIGRGEQGVLLVRPYTNYICKYWRFKTPLDALKSSQKILDIFLYFRAKRDFIGMDMARKFLEMGFTRARRYANHNSGKKYDKNGKILPQEKDWVTSRYAVAANIFKKKRDRVAKDLIYKKYRKDWRELEEFYSTLDSQR